MFKKFASFALLLAVVGLFAATSTHAQRLIKGGLVKSAQPVETTFEVIPEANPAFDPAQCANGGIGSPVQSCGTSGSNNWETGNMNGSKAHYQEGRSIHYRYVFSNLTAGPTVYTIRLAYDAFKDPTQHAIDYLNTYDADIDQDPDKVYQVIPCGGVTGCAAFSPNTIDIPDDPQLQNYVTTAGTQGIEPPTVAGSRVFTGWGLTFVSATFLPYNAANAERMIEVKFTAQAATAVLAWSGHVALGSEWNGFLGGAHGGAGSISGSPYHMRNGGSGSFGDGQRELQLAANAVVLVPSAADAAVAGRVTDAFGRAISSAKLTLHNASTGEMSIVYTNSFGYYKFEGIPVGDFFVMSVEARRYIFVNGSVSFSLEDSIEGLNFQASR